MSVAGVLLGGTPLYQQLRAGVVDRVEASYAKVRGATQLVGWLVVSSVDYRGYGWLDRLGGWWVGGGKLRQGKGRHVGRSWLAVWVVVMVGRSG